MNSLQMLFAALLAFGIYGFGKFADSLEHRQQR